MYGSRRYSNLLVLFRVVFVPTCAVCPLMYRSERARALLIILFISWVVRLYIIIYNDNNIITSISDDFVQDPPDEEEKSMKRKPKLYVNNYYIKLFFSRKYYIIDNIILSDYFSTQRY